MAFLALLGLLTPARAGMPTSGVTSFNLVPTQTVLANSSAGSPGATATNISGWDFNAVSPSSFLINVDVKDGAVGSANGVAISHSDGSSADFSVVTVSANDHSTFDLESVGLNIQIVQGSTAVSGHSVTLIGLNSAGNAIPGATLTSTVNDAQLVSFDVSSNPSFNGISAFSIVPVTVGDSLGYVFLDDISAINFAALDNVAPDAPSVPHLGVGSDTGTSSSDNLTNINSPVFTGTAEANTTVKLYDTDGITVIGSGTATGGNWSITSIYLAQGNHNITARATDAAGNVSAASVSLTITVDSVSPLVTAVVLPANNNYGAGDNLDFTVTYSKAITVTTIGGTPYISVSLDTGGVVRASFLYGSGTSVLTFRYTVVNGNYDANGIAAGSSITLNSGTLRDTAGNSANLTLTGIGSTGGIRVDATPPTVTSINRVQTSPTNVATLSYTVTFSKPVTGVDVSDFNLTTTGSIQPLNINVAQLTTSTYTVTISSITGEGTMRLDLKSSNTGIMDLAGNPISSGYTAGQIYTVDRVAPTVSSVGVPANTTYLATQNLSFTVTFSEVVQVTTTGGVQRLPITLDTGGTVYAVYVSGTNTATLTFRYTVVAGNADADGITVSSALQTNGGTIRDTVGNDATLTLKNVPSTANVLVDAIAPTVTSVILPINGTYTAGQTLDFTVNFSEAVTVNTTAGVPYMSVTLDTGGSVHATYVSGSGTTALAFRYTVVTGNSDLNGIIVVSNITASGATIKDASGNNASLALGSTGVTAGILIDAIAPTVTSINRQAPTGASTNLPTVNFRVTFSEAVTGVDTTDFVLTTTNDVAGTVSAVTAVSGSIYDVTVTSIMGTGTLRLDFKASGTGVTDYAGNPIVTGALGTQLYTIDTVAPTIASVTVPGGGTYKVGDNLDFTVTFSEIVTTTGSPRLPITLESGTVNASYVSGTGTTALVFRYTVAAGALDTDGVSLASALTLNGGAILDPAGNSAVLTLNNVGNTIPVRVDGVAPTVLSVGVPAGGTYKLGSQLDFTVTFSENVTVTGVPRLGVTLDTGGTANANYLSGSGTSTLVFRYTVATGNADRNGIVLGSAIVLNSGALRDTAGNAAVLPLNNAGATDTILIDGIVPTVTSITKIGSAFTTATSLDYTVTFSESVTGVTAASFVLTTTGTVDASIASITPTTATAYKVTLNPVSGDGTLRLDLAASGTGIADLATNAIAAGFTTGDIYTLDHTAPAVTSVTVPANGIYPSGQKLDFTVRLSEAATVSTTGGTPYLPVTLDTGGNVRATYVSGTGTTALLFRYTIAAGNLDPNGITLGTSLTANGGTLRDTAGNDLNPVLNGLPSTAGVLVDAIAPAVLSVTSPADGTYIKGAVLDFTVTYSEPVNVVTTAGTPNLPITLATGGPAQATYVSGSGSSTLTFRYTVAAGQQDIDGIAVTSAIALKSGTIRDAAGNDAGLVTPAFSTAGVLVDGLVPAVASIARFLPTTATTSQDSVKYRVTFNKDVTGVDIGDFLLTPTGTAAGTLGTLTAVSAKVYDVAVDSLAFGGTIRLDLKASSGIADTAGNPLTTAFTGGETYTLAHNDAPSFTPGSDIVIGQDAGAQTVAQWATDINAGAPSESSQVLSFTVTADQPSLFTTPPAISSNGTLTFAPNPAASGTATLTVILHDSADANNASEPATFTIAFTSYEGQLGTYNGLVQAAPDTAVGNDKTGLLHVVIGAKGAFSGSLKLAGTAFTLRGSFNKSGEASFGTGKTATSNLNLKRRNLPTLALSLRLDVSDGTDTLTATLTDDGADFAVVEADRALYVATPNPVAPLRNVPTYLLGRYTVVFGAKSPDDQRRSPVEYPQGDGVGLLFVTTNGVARIIGNLADGTAISCSNPLSKGNQWPFYSPSLAGKASISAVVTFRDRPELSDFDALDIRWYKPGIKAAKLYPAGWPDGIQVDMLGSKFIIPQAVTKTSIFTGLDSEDPAGNATATVMDGGLPSTLVKALNITPANGVKVLSPGLDKLTLKMLFPLDRLDPTAPQHRKGLYPNGRFVGAVTNPVTKVSSVVNGIIFQKQKSGFGYFTGKTECGSVTLDPQ